MPETRQRFVAIMFGEATRMRDLLDDLMSLSRIEAERFALPRDTVDLMPLIEEVKAALKPLAEGRAIRVENAAGERPGQRRPRPARADAEQPRRQRAQIWPARERRSGSASTMPGRTSSGSASIDKGDGIPADHIPRLTERFYRVDPGRSRSVGGTGLGLAIVKHIVLRHRGRLDIKSKLGEGTTVEVSLPRAAEPCHHDNVTSRQQWTALAGHGTVAAS